MNLIRVSAQEAALYLPGLCALLKDVVEAGASVGFVPPLADGEMQAYWQDVFASLDPSKRLLFVVLDGQRPVGSVQLTLERRVNGNHRAEVNKLVVHPSARRRGIATALMGALEEAARANGRTLLVLDTVVGDHAERLYRRLGYQAAGVIPRYARNAAGGFDATLYMYKDLDTPEPAAAMA